MGGSRVGRVLVLVPLMVSCRSDATETRRATGGVHVPIIRRSASGLSRRSVNSGSIGLGDFEDITYNVMLQVGETHIPVVLDTGSSDMWVLSTSQCRESCGEDQVPLYPLSSFQPAHLESVLIYGDSSTGTYAEGPVGSDFVSLAGLGLQRQYFSAINYTNTSVVQTGSGGIFGLGFPFNSPLWIHLAARQNVSGKVVGHRDVPLEADAGANARFPEHLQNLVMRWFLKSDQGDDAGPLVRSMRQLRTTTALRSSIITYGPLIPRLAAQGVLDSPMFSITLQRDAIQIGGNEGMLSIGQLPPTVPGESLTWVGVRGYPPSQGGLNPPSDTLGEVYPIAWEIPLDDVWFDGIRLERSKLSSPNISLSALIDTGNSLIRGPPDVVAQIYTILGAHTFPCSPPHTLEFQISGKLFPVDPRDFVREVRPGDPNLCFANVVQTDVPVSGGVGYLYSWNLGDPFLKGVLAAFHYGSLTHPSQNPPRVGLLSTVDADAGKQLCEDEHKAELEHEGYPMIVEPAPDALPPARGTGIGGVPLAQRPTATQSHVPELVPGLLANGGPGDVQIGIGVWTVVLAGVMMAWFTWRITG